MTITTIDELIAGFREVRGFHKLLATAEGAGTFHSLWKVGGYPGAGSNPPAYSSGSGYACSSATDGALPYTDPTGGDSGYLTRFLCGTPSVSTIVLYDRLWTCSGLVTNTGSTQTITTPGALPARDVNGLTDGDGVELWGEVYTAPGASGATWTVNYKDQDNNNGAATYAHPANAEAVGQMFPFVMAAGDVGVRSVVDFTCSVTSGTAGDIGLTLLRRVAEIPIGLIGTSPMLGPLATGMPVIYDGSCLALFIHASTTTVGPISGAYGFAHG